ncbi:MULTISPECIES: type II toxin-antitoxin system RelE/ParE family toxin [Okeania]|uniref:Type II toxin-antitoxin system RelE/ParE family toxin n=1 Tax=Okeania hirsuta TaxID=1458930 RepID=A0A3N6P0C3_9CYAN|nr:MULTISPECIES: type II toxin-antitoxin system RelE/ParE family toxin [Okeania]NEP04535.1 type II toxin-antitoxin system RelE/ParE family toxin [Okeania sp. SIO4D6]NEP40248.1 type II toxin-antitoxin system RelE/ParE family toxin [Okeania sp. SIO2H7]NET17388.1 type II toxin-antitoxin system RelE/ParE family toxin [Okeania sp. SIO1H6]NEP70879.1 type II toxin-antitoxin system RelE/ParE family toxin [Okeania sp. SIO2G5]NEP87523.1 type II toxin-antitoxin system RelE/ParE family toxin [Okeania sp. 
MGYKVVWSSKAIDDVDAIASYIARDSVSYTAAVVHRIINVTKNLIHNPLQGEVVKEFGDESYRQDYAYSYRVLYQVKGNIVIVAAVIHGKRLLDL